jgi:hypothetical protein
MIKPAMWPNTSRATRSTSPWVDVYFRRDTQIDGMIITQLDKTVDYADLINNNPVVPGSVTNDPLTGVCSFTVYFAPGANPGSQPIDAPQEWVGKVFVGGGGIGTITSVQGQVFTVNLAENEIGNRTLDSAGIISNYSVYAPINFGYHYLQDASRPMNLLGWETNNNPGGYRKASALLLENKRFIQEEVINYIDATYSVPFTYNPAKCARDTGLVVDAIVQDLLFSTSSQTTSNIGIKIVMLVLLVQKLFLLLIPLTILQH